MWPLDGRLTGDHGVTPLPGVTRYDPNTGGRVVRLDSVTNRMRAGLLQAQLDPDKAADFVDGVLVARGGRVLAVTARGPTLAESAARAYRAIDQLDYADGFHRRDIGWRELARQRQGAEA